MLRAGAALGCHHRGCSDSQAAIPSLKITCAAASRPPSSVPRLQGASFLYVLCDFWLEPDDDAARYTLLIDDVDDGARVLLDGDVLGGLLYGQGGSWNLAGRASGRLHSVLVIVEDNAAVDKYVLGLRFLRDGIPVGT